MSKATYQYKDIATTVGSTAAVVGIGAAVANTAPLVGIALATAGASIAASALYFKLMGESDEKREDE